MYCEVTPNEPNPATAAIIPDSKNSIEEWLSEDFLSWEFFSLAANIVNTMHAIIRGRSDKNDESVIWYINIKAISSDPPTKKFQHLLILAESFYARCILSRKMLRS
jgi:hypothetical protein